jgi:hypothetical protein
MANNRMPLMLAPEDFTGWLGTPEDRAALLRGAWSFAKMNTPKTRFWHGFGLIAFCSKLPSCIIAMEACCGAHHMGRVLAQQGHEIIRSRC